MHYLRLFITEKSDNYWHFAHIIPHAKTCGDNLQKNSKSNETRIFAEGRQGRWIFFFKLQLELALSMLKICLLMLQGIHYPHSVHWGINPPFKPPPLPPPLFRSFVPSPSLDLKTVQTFPF